MIKKAKAFREVFGVIALFSGFSFHVNAEATEKSSEWSGNISLIPVSYSQKSQFAAEHENRVTNDLDNSGKRFEKITAYPVFNLSYSPNGLNTSFFLGNSQEQVTKGQIAIELGIVYSFDTNSRIVVAAFPELPFSGDAWKDPYLVSKDREKTKEKAAGGRIKFEHVGDYIFDLQYAFSKSRIDTEESGFSFIVPDEFDISKLNRDAEFHRFSLNTNLSVSESITIVPGIKITRSDAVGDFNDYAEGALFLQTTYLSDSGLFSAKVSHGRLESDFKNETFDSFQKDNKSSVEIFYSHPGFMGYENLSFLCLAMWMHVESNIQFFDSDTKIIGVGFGYSW